MKLQEMFADGSTWTQGSQACTSTGCQCFADDPQAARFDLLSAIARCYLDAAERAAVEKKLAAHLLRTVPPESEAGYMDRGMDEKNAADVIISDWNDDFYRTAHDVYALCKELDI